LRFKLFKGVSIQLKDTKNADETAAEVAKLPQVKAVYPVRRYPVPLHVVHSTGDAVREFIAKRQGGNDTFSTHLMTQVNKFRAAGITGKGIKIGVIDTGVSVSRTRMASCLPALASH
jgi:subtilisin family serine protease